MTNKILWADDEIDLLKPHILFLKTKGYDVYTVNNGHDALDMVDNQRFDLIILDENMPGLTGLETLQKIKLSAPSTPVIMITKNEEENIMNQAIGSKISDYLIKPVNPNQILLSIKKNLHSDALISQQATRDYRDEFARISSLIGECREIGDWYDLYQRLVYWELELAATETNMDDLLAMQKNEANNAFTKFIYRNYLSWFDEGKPRPMMSPDILPKRLFPLIDDGRKVFVVVIDNFRLDQWRVLKPILAEYFTFEEELYTAILPTATQFARNAIFSGLLPNDIARLFPDLWVDEDSEEGKNLNESPLISTLFKRYRRDIRFSYNKVNESATGEQLLRDFANLAHNDVNFLVLNFIDMLSHARTESKMIRELAANSAAYRSLTESWFRHSPAFDLLKRMAEKGYTVLLTTDHGSIQVDHPIKVVGDRNLTSNLRYKAGKNMTYNNREVYEIKRPGDAGLPALNLSTTYIFASNHDFFAYPNNYNHYVQYYTDTFQHGGISLEEMLVPLITMTPR